MCLCTIIRKYRQGVAQAFARFSWWVVECRSVVSDDWSGRKSVFWWRPIRRLGKICALTSWSGPCWPIRASWRTSWIRLRIYGPMRKGNMGRYSRHSTWKVKHSLSKELLDNLAHWAFSQKVSNMKNSKKPVNRLKNAIKVIITLNKQPNIYWCSRLKTSTKLTQQKTAV